MIQYPAELPLPLQDGYGLETPVDPMLRTQMESGRARQRVLFDSVPDHVNAKWNCDRNQMAFFRGWYARTLNQGVEWFTTRLLLPEGFIDVECRFTGKPSGPTLVQVSRWEYSATLELREPSLIDPWWDMFPEYWFMMDVIDRAVNQQWPLSKYEIHMDAFDYGVNEEWPQP